MGWWTQSEEGVSLSGKDRQPEPLLWGDGPADIVDNAIFEITALFIRDHARLPSQAEIMAGLTFSTATGMDLPDRPENSPHVNNELVAAVNKHYYTMTLGDKPIPRDVLLSRRTIANVIDQLKKPFRAKKRTR